MLLTLTTTLAPATDLGHLLHKNPSRAHVFDLSFGKAHVFYPEADHERCTAALLLEIDPVALVRGRTATFEQYVNDRRIGFEGGSQQGPPVPTAFATPADARVDESRA